MRKLMVGLILFASPICWAVIIEPDDEIIKRGDANGDQAVNISDAAYISNYLFNQGPEPPCLNQADVNNDGQVDVSDPAFLTNFLFNGGPEPPYPGPYGTECVADDSPRPGCAISPCD